MTDGRGAEDNSSSESDNRNGRDGDGDVHGIPLVEKVVMVSSILFTVSLFAFAVWQSLTGAGAVAPAVDVVDHHTASDGDVIYTVELRNPGDIGLVRATVDAECTNPPIELTFENVPSGGRRTGTVICPPGTTDPRVSVESWVHE